MYIVGKVKAYDKIWIFCDKFVFCSLNKALLSQLKKQAYMTDQYDVSEFISSEYNNTNQNMLSRTRNLIVHAVQSQTLFPKIIVIMIDDDIMQYLNEDLDKTALTICFQKLLHNVMMEYDWIIESHKENLNAKSIR